MAEMRPRPHNLLLWADVYREITDVAHSFRYGILQYIDWLRIIYCKTSISFRRCWWRVIFCVIFLLAYIWNHHCRSFIYMQVFEVGVHWSFLTSSVQCACYWIHLGSFDGKRCQPFICVFDDSIIPAVGHSVSVGSNSLTVMYCVCFTFRHTCMLFPQRLK